MQSSSSAHASLFPRRRNNEREEVRRATTRNAESKIEMRGTAVGAASSVSSSIHNKVDTCRHRFTCISSLFFSPLNKLSKNWPSTLFRLRDARRRESTRTNTRLDAQIGKAHGWNVFTLRTSLAERQRDVTTTGVESLWGKEGSPRCSDGEVLEVCHYDVCRLVLQLVAGLNGVAVPFLALHVLVLALQLLQFLLGLGREPLLRRKEHSVRPFAREIMCTWSASDEKILCCRYCFVSTYSSD